MPDGKAESVKRVFDYLEAGLGINVFRRLFPIILTDNGSEFKRVDDLELTPEEDSLLTYRTHLYYCDPMASWQKGVLRKIMNLSDMQYLKRKVLIHTHRKTSHCL